MKKTLILTALAIFGAGAAEASTYKLSAPDEKKEEKLFDEKENLIDKANGIMQTKCLSIMLKNSNATMIHFADYESATYRDNPTYTVPCIDKEMRDAVREINKIAGKIDDLRQENSV